MTVTFCNTLNFDKNMQPNIPQMSQTIMQKSITQLQSQLTCTVESSPSSWGPDYCESVSLVQVYFIPLPLPAS